MTIQEYDNVSQVPCDCCLIKVHLNNSIINQSTCNQYVVNVPVFNVHLTICILHCLVHWKHYMYLFRNCNFINEIRILECVVQEILQT